MRKRSLAVLATLFLALVLAVPATAWQGRMAGTGDAAGLIADESDFLTHPAYLASGKGVNAYGHFGLAYEKTSTWDYKSSAPTLGWVYPYEAGGNTWKTNLQLGSAFALGAGRMGVFFEYDGSKGKYDGQENYSGFGSGSRNIELDDQFNNLKLRVLYGIPAGAVNLGGELQIGYVNEEKETLLSEFGGDFWRNWPWAAENAPALSLYPFIIPFDSKYWEARGKISAAGAAGPGSYAVTVNAGLPFASHNQYFLAYDSGDAATMEGNVKGYSVGADAWFRLPLSAKMVLPLVVSIGYKKIERDGSGLSNYSSALNYEHTAKNLNAKLGGGVEMTPSEGTKIAAGLYYDYISTKQDIYIEDIFNSITYYADTYGKMPDASEHRLTVKVAAEKDLTRMVVLRGGFSVYYGRAKNDYAYSADSSGSSYDALEVSVDGSTMGVNASIGATVNLGQVGLEPFLSAGYAKYSADGDGFLGSLPVSVDMDKTNWLVGGGLSVKF